MEARAIIMRLRTVADFPKAHRYRHDGLTEQAGDQRKLRISEKVGIKSAVLEYVNNRGMTG